MITYGIQVPPSLKNAMSMQKTPTKGFFENTSSNDDDDGDDDGDDDDDDDDELWRLINGYPSVTLLLITGIHIPVKISVVFVC